MDNYPFPFCTFLETPMLVSIAGLEPPFHTVSPERQPKAVFKRDLVFTEIH